MPDYEIRRTMIRRVEIKIVETVEVEADSIDEAELRAGRGEGDVMDYDEPDGFFEYTEDDILDCVIDDSDLVEY